ncbi:DUF2802 domain-containing protein [Propionivibrio soli]|uniref:DUF2802 domain-containing protein n=1 Tax=Propionivibrio soli TaxID=2976531 RepID=UPI0021E86945|nr:DUF2802 domain-containing protein [Propionivibrio soli]
MDVAVLGNLGWREALIACVVLLLFYVVVLLLRVRRLKKQNSPQNAIDLFAAQTAVAAYENVQEPKEPALSPDPVLPSAPGMEPKPEPQFAWNEPPEEPSLSQRMEVFERELSIVRKELESLRRDIQRVDAEQRREHAGSQAAQNVSPLYSDAMQMAVQGHDAAAISQHCGIARAEAELVVALARNRDMG